MDNLTVKIGGGIQSVEGELSFEYVASSNEIVLLIHLLPTVELQGSCYIFLSEENLRKALRFLEASKLDSDGPDVQFEE